VLRRMGRTGDGADYLALLDRARLAMPDVSVRTTFIVGFPGESEADFAALLDFCTAASFDHGGAFVFSPEEGTPAARLGPRVSETVAHDRLGRLSSMLLSRAEQANTERVGSVVDVMIDTLGAEEGPEGVVAVGRTSRQAPDVDGVTFLEGDLPDGVGPGDLIRAVVTEAYGYDLFARCHEVGRPDAHDDV
jgi:ribosomal protein S12 methylthiotransferase